MKKILTIIGSLLFSFFIVIFIGQFVFIGDTPLVNPQFIAGIKNAPQTIAAIPANIFRSSDTASNYVPNIPATTPEVSMFTKSFNRLAPGVYAREEGGVMYYRQVESEQQTTEISLINSCGKTIKLTYPTNNPPVKEMLDIIKEKC